MRYFVQFARFWRFYSNISQFQSVRYFVQFKQFGRIFQHLTSFTSVPSASSGRFSSIFLEPIVAWIVPEIWISSVFPFLRLYFKFPLLDGATFSIDHLNLWLDQYCTCNKLWGQPMFEINIITHQFLGHRLIRLSEDTVKSYNQQ